MPYHRTSAAVSIRPMDEPDVFAIHDIHTACLRVRLPSHYSEEQLNAWLDGRTPQGYWRGASQGETFLVAEIDGAVVGFANRQDNELLSLFVHPQHQRTAIGARLFLSCEQMAPIDQVKATLGAVDFYKRLGFLEVRREAAPKKGVPIPHLLMRRRSARGAK